MQVVIKTQGDLVRQAMEFRARIMYETFGLEPTLDADQWDTVAWHIIAVDNARVVGYYRAIPYTAMGFCSEIEFDLSPLQMPRSQVMEVGRASTDQSNPMIIVALWRGVLNLADELGQKWVMGTASFKTSEYDVNFLARQWVDRYNYHASSHAIPRGPQVIDQGGHDQSVPNLIRAYENLGARVVSDPAWDPRFQTADVLTLLETSAVTPAWRRRLGLNGSAGTDA